VRSDLLAKLISDRVKVAMEWRVYIWIRWVLGLYMDGGAAAKIAQTRI
jgi:hypothetical protein